MPFPLTVRYNKIVLKHLRILTAFISANCNFYMTIKCEGRTPWLQVPGHIWRKFGLIGNCFC